jgi:hypothetical protein
MPSIPATHQEDKALLNPPLVDVVRRAARQLLVEKVVVGVVMATQGGLDGGVSWLATGGERGFWEEWP